MVILIPHIYAIFMFSDASKSAGHLTITCLAQLLCGLMSIQSKIAACLEDSSQLEKVLKLLETIPDNSPISVSITNSYTN